MKVSRIILKNWLNFQSVDVPLDERIFLIGANASGKSNFLDAFRFLHDIAKTGGGLQRAVTERGGLTSIRCFTTPNSSPVELEVHLTESFLSSERRMGKVKPTQVLMTDVTKVLPILPSLKTLNTVA
jgi:predicted ATPase